MIWLVPFSNEMGAARWMIDAQISWRGRCKNSHVMNPDSNLQDKVLVSTFVESKPRQKQVKAGQTLTAADRKTL